MCNRLSSGLALTSFKYSLIAFLDCPLRMYFCAMSNILSLSMPKFSSTWSPTGKPVVPQNHTHLRQGFGGSSAAERNPPKHDGLIAEMVYRALTHSSTAKAVVSCVGG